MQGIHRGLLPDLNTNKKKNTTNPFGLIVFGLSGTLRKLGVHDRRVANKTSRSGERGRRRQNLRYPVKSHRRKRQMIVDFCRFLLALLTSRRKNRRLEGFYLLTLQPQVCRLRRHLAWQNDQSSILSLKNECGNAEN